MIAPHLAPAGIPPPNCFGRFAASAFPPLSPLPDYLHQAQGGGSPSQKLARVCCVRRERRVQVLVLIGA